MLALASLVRDPLGKFTFSNGILYPLPIELYDKTRIDSYCKINSLGWSVSEFGYHAYVTQLPKGGALILPALMIVDGARVGKRFHGYSATFTRDQVENIASSYVSIIKNAESAALRDQGILIHDLRAISDAIYHSAVEASGFNEQRNYGECHKRIENIIASQGMLQMRTDAIDYVGNALQNYSEERIPVFRKVDKVVRCFKSRASGKKKSVNLYGNSFQRTWGMPILELIPYGLIDNGLKYCPEGGSVDVEVRDERGNTIISVTSFGPKIDQAESIKIFKQGMRCAAAISTNIPGEGIGLYMVEKITRESFGGSVSVDQVSTPVIGADRLAYFQTTFEVIIPSS